MRKPRYLAHMPRVWRYLERDLQHEALTPLRQWYDRGHTGSGAQHWRNASVTELRRAMILAAGLGTRMAPLTLETPKPLIKLAGKALIDHAIDRLVAGGVNFIVVNVHYKAEQIIEHLDNAGARNRTKSRSSFPTNAKSCSIRARGSRRPCPFSRNEPFFTYNSDSLWVEGMGSSHRPA